MVGGMTWRLVSRRPSPSIVQGRHREIEFAPFARKAVTPANPSGLRLSNPPGPQTIIALAVRQSTDKLSLGDDL